MANTTIISLGGAKTYPDIAKASISDSRSTEQVDSTYTRGGFDMTITQFDNIDVKARAEAIAEAKRKKSAAITAKGRATDRRSGETRSPQDAITSFCSECITSYGLDVAGHGSVLGAITACDTLECHLWPWRRGRLVFDEDGGVT